MKSPLVEGHCYKVSTVRTLFLLEGASENNLDPEKPVHFFPVTSWLSLFVGDWSLLGPLQGVFSLFILFQENGVIEINWCAKFPGN